MKARMKKIEILCPEESVKPMLDSLRTLGCLHFEALEEKPNYLESKDYKLYHKAYTLASQADNEGANIHSDFTSERDLESQSRRLLKFEEDLKVLEHQLESNTIKLDLKHIWGDYDLEKWTRLENAGLELQFYSLPQGQFEKFNFEDQRPILIVKGNETTFFALITAKEKQTSLALESLKIPKESIAALDEERAHLQSQISKVKQSLKEESQFVERVKDKTLQLQDEIQREQIEKEIGSIEKLKIKHLKAWYREDKIDLIRVKLEEYNCAFTTCSPQIGDRVPVQLTNNGFKKLFEPITEIFQLPHYFEFDLTPFIAVFYPILFAYCLGDAGYGFILSVIAIVAYFGFLKKQGHAALLLLILGLTTLVMGFIKSGSLFGIPLLENSSMPWVRSLSKLVLIPDDSDYFFNAFNVALLIGLLQILVGIGIAIYKTWSYKGFWPALAQIGKLIIVLSTVSLFLEETLGLTVLMALILKWLLLLGISLVMFFHDMSQHILSRLGSSVLPLFFIFTGLLGDILSYVRLFALGVTSGVLGLVVNQIGTDMIGESWYSYVMAILFLIFGHSLNLALAVLGSFIHPLRLTFVEFYNNAQFEGGGKAFESFTKSIKIN
jgi:V/A-type H+-transporting ATPase subunit I